MGITVFNIVIMHQILRLVQGNWGRFDNRLDGPENSVVMLFALLSKRNHNDCFDE